MARPRSTEGYLSEANIWPAVTDTILLMASIFIVLSVISLISIVRKVDDQAGAGKNEGEKVICEMVGLSADLLFPSGKATFINAPAARSDLVRKLEYLAPRRAGLENYARSQKDWGAYYLVLEVSGHTDSDPLHGGTRNSDDGNWDLAAQRAVTVAHELEDILRQRQDLRAQFKVELADPSQAAAPPTAPAGATVLRVAGYGSHLPARDYPPAGADPHATVLAKGQNRRVELRLYAQPVYLVRQKVGTR